MSALSQLSGYIEAIAVTIPLVFIGYMYKDFLFWILKTYAVFIFWFAVFMFSISFLTQYIVFFFYTINSAIAVSFSPLIAHQTMQAISAIIFGFFCFLILRIIYPIISNLKK